MEEVNKNLILKVVGTMGIIGGSVALYLGGVGESAVAAVVAGVFVLAGLVAVLFKGVQK